MTIQKYRLYFEYDQQTFFSLHLYISLRHQQSNFIQPFLKASLNSLVGVLKLNVLKGEFEQINVTCITPILFL